MIVGLAVVVWVAFGLQNSSQHKVLFEKAKFTMETKGDLRGAIKLFAEIIEKYPDEREYAAKSQLYIGFCYEKLGFREAQAAFQRVVENYPEQTEAVVIAKEKLMTLTRLQTLASDTDGRFHLRRIGEASTEWKGGSLSPLGGFFVFADRMHSYGDVAVYDLSSGKVRRLTNDANETEGAYECVISRDGKRIAYAWLNNSDGSKGLRVVEMGSAEANILYRDTNSIPMAPADWTADGKQILAYHKGIALVSTTNGSIKMLKESWPNKYPYWNGRMRISPDGRYIAYNWPPEGDRTSQSIFLLATDGTYDAPLIDKTSNDVLLDWCPDGRSLLFRSDRTGSWDAWRIRINDGKADGPAELVKKNIGAIEPLGFTQDGSFHFISSLGGWNIYTAKIDLSAGTVTELPVNPIERNVGGNVSAAWSPDGKYLAYIAAGAIYTRSEETGEEKKISPQPGFYGIEWFPDGLSLKVYGEDGKGNRGLFRVNTRTGAVETLLMQTPEVGLHRVSLGPEGKYIYLSTYRTSENLSSISAYEIQSKLRREIWRGAGKVGRVVPSPNGQWLAAEIQKPGMSDSFLVIMPLSGGEMRELAASNSGGEFAWTPDSKQLLFGKFVAGEGWGSSQQELWAVSVEGGPPKSLNLKTRLMWLLTVHPDGKRIAYSGHNSKAEIWVMENFLPDEK